MTRTQWNTAAHRSLPTRTKETSLIFGLSAGGAHNHDIGHSLDTGTFVSERHGSEREHVHTCLVMVAQHDEQKTPQPTRGGGLCLERYRGHPSQTQTSKQKHNEGKNGIPGGEVQAGRRR